MKDLLRMIAVELVDHPEQVSISEREEDNKIVLELRVAPEDMGKVIGKQGRIAKSIRTIIKATTASESKKVVVDIKE
ncbi:MAG: KH domain-containing protein [Cellulosilyticum sp.]|nr:KH domain-containing protein [Cellulosilyticum sp.]